VELDYVTLSSAIIEIDQKLSHGLTEVKNHGYVTEGMANGEPTPDWVPIKREQAIKEAMEFLKNDPHLNAEESSKVDKRSKQAYSEEEWDEKKNARKEKSNEKKRKLEEYDELVLQVEAYKEKASKYKDKFMKCRAYFLANNVNVPE
jgi:hypothetical protein